MEWLQSIFNSENNALQLVLIFLGLVIAVILIGWIFRRIAGTPARRAAKNRVPRLSITDVTAVDEKRFLVLARRDNVEHLLLIGGSNDVVVENNIVRTQSVQPQNQGAKSKQPLAATTAATREVAQETSNTAKPVAETPKVAETDKPAIAAAVATGAATATAGLAATSAAVSDAAGTVGEKASETVSAVSETVVDTAESAADLVADAGEMISETVDTGVETVASVIDTSDEVEVDEPDLGIDLESELSQQLDSALSEETLDISVDIPEAESGDVAVDLTPEPVAETAQVDAPEVEMAQAVDDAAPEEDDMQKLLQELANETKEPA